MINYSNIEKIKKFDDLISEDFLLVSHRVKRLVEIFHDDLTPSPRKFIDSMNDKTLSCFQPDRILEFFFLIRSDVLLKPSRCWKS